LRTQARGATTSLLAFFLIVGWAFLELMWAAFRQWGTSSPQSLDAGLSARDTLGAILLPIAFAGIVVAISAAVVAVIELRASRGLALLRPLVFVAATAAAVWTTVVTLQSGSDAIVLAAVGVMLICFACLSLGRSSSAAEPTLVDA
jgi:hypothetical protein